MTRLSPDGESVYRVSIAMIILTGIAVFLRFLTRLQVKASPAADDCWVVAALVFYYTSQGMQLWSLLAGQRDSLDPVSYDTQVHTAKVLYAEIPFSIATTAAAKISILCLYRRIFTTQSFRRNSLLTGAVVVAYWLSGTIGVIFNCTPVKAAYDERVPGRCIDFPAFFLAYEIVNCILDIVMLCLPIQVIRQLHMPTAKKIQLSFIFFLGSLTLIVGIVRMAIVYRAGSDILNEDREDIMETIENGLAIICACLPTYRPLLSSFQAVFVNIRTLYTSLLRTTRSKGSGLSESASSTGEARKRYSHIHDGSNDKTFLTEAVGGVASEDTLIGGQDHPLNAIKVKSTAEVV